LGGKLGWLCPGAGPYLQEMNAAKWKVVFKIQTPDNLVEGTKFQNTRKDAQDYREKLKRVYGKYLVECYVLPNTDNSKNNDKS
jgi:hypothetical protein